MKTNTLLTHGPIGAPSSQTAPRPQPLPKRRTLSGMTPRKNTGALLMKTNIMLPHGPTGATSSLTAPMPHPLPKRRTPSGTTHRKNTGAQLKRMNIMLPHGTVGAPSSLHAPMRHPLPKRRMLSGMTQKKKYSQSSSIKPALPAYNQACLAALRNRPLENILHYLNIALKGEELPSLRHMQDDSDLDSIRDTPEFKAFIEKVRALDRPIDKE